MSNTNLDIKDKVREHYAGVAKGESNCCASDTSCCCSASEQIGYSKEELASVPQDAEMGLGCGTPVSLAMLQPAETVVDLGSGGGIDCFLAAKAVGPNGRVIGVDMTPEMLSKARQSAVKGGYENVEFRLGEIENLPVADNTADVVISNCVINLSPNKLQVYKEAQRVLRPGGRLAVSDMVSLAPLPDALKNDVALYTGCVAGTVSVQQIESWLAEAGFESIGVQVKKKSSEFIQGGGETLDAYIASADVTALKP
jgi:SAM-dependent methyltransferase